MNKAGAAEKKGKEFERWNIAFVAYSAELSRLRSLP